MRLTTEQFIEKARFIHGYRYDYSLVEYISRNTKVKIICKDHGVFEQTPHKHLARRGCNKCANIQRKQTILLRYGVEYPAQNKEIHKKMEQTCLERYGVENPFQSKESQERSRQTILLRYGVEYPAQNKKVQEKYKQTNIERYGVEYPAQNKEIHKKMEQTSIEKHGVKHALQKHYSKNTTSKLNSFDYLFDEYVNKNRTTRQIGNQLSVDKHTICDYLRIQNIPIFHVAKFSKLAIQWLESISQEQSIYIQHAGNIGEYNIPNTRLLVDGYCSSNNTIYEFYGDCFHGNLDVYKEEDHPHPFNLEITTMELYNKTMERENRIKELGYDIVSIWENEFTDPLMKD